MGHMSNECTGGMGYGSMGHIGNGVIWVMGYRGYGAHG